MTAAVSRVAVIGTGGSISIPARHALDLHEYADVGEPLAADALLARLPEAGAGFDIVPVNFETIISPAITPAHWLALVRTIEATVANDPAIAGVVITHGTSTLEESAYFLHLAATVDVPVVVVGAQRPPGGLASDAPINLLNALRVAAAPAARGLGALVVFNDAIQCARDVTKAANYRLDAFRTPDFGVLGHVEPDGSLAFYRRPTRRHYPETAFHVAALDALPLVDIVYGYAGADGRAIEALVASGSRAIVIAALAPARPTPAQHDALLTAVQAGVVVVLSSRAGSGRVLERARDLADGFVAADNLNPQKARVLAMLALTVTDDVAEIRRMFAEY